MCTGYVASALGLWWFSTFFHNMIFVISTYACVLFSGMSIKPCNGQQTCSGWMYWHSRWCSRANPRVYSRTAEWGIYFFLFILSLDLTLGVYMLKILVVHLLVIIKVRNIALQWAGWGLVLINDCCYCYSLMFFALYLMSFNLLLRHL